MSHERCSSHCCRSGRWAVRSEGAAGLPPLLSPFPCKVAASTCIIQIAADVAPGRPLNQQILPCSSFTPPDFFSYLSVLPACFCCCLFAQVLPLCPSRGRRHLGGCLTTVRSSHQAAGELGFAVCAQEFPLWGHSEQLPEKSHQPYGESWGTKWVAEQLTGDIKRERENKCAINSLEARESPGWLLNQARDNSRWQGKVTSLKDCGLGLTCQNCIWLHSSMISEQDWFFFFKPE